MFVRRNNKPVISLDWVNKKNFAAKAYNSQSKILNIKHKNKTGLK